MLNGEEIEKQLTDGTIIKLRLLGPGDREHLRRGFEALSVRTRRLRFLTLQSRLTEPQLDYLTSMDNINHLALCAFDTSDGDHMGVGVGRYIRMADEPDTAEIAVTVLDAYQGRGVGRLLGEQLVEAALANGIKTFRGYIAHENATLITMLKEMGARSELNGGHMTRIDLDLPLKAQGPVIRE